jgi:hypothetical protein
MRCAECRASSCSHVYAQDHLKPQQQLVVFSDSQHALRAIQAGNSARTRRARLAKIAQSTTSLCRAGMDLRSRWSPGHSGIIGNKEADEAARTESNREGKPTAPALERVREVSGFIRLINEGRSKDLTALDTTSIPGRYTWKMDQALPGKLTLQLYGSLTSDQTSILMEARMRHCRLNQYLARGGTVDSADCECGNDKEVVRNVVLSCSRWAERRREPWAAAGDRSGDLTYLLAG